ncbi:amino acid adenylation domain-containing protein [Streptomyces durbertensis]|uniref:Amino acid adenylation domain-containing protein n=1 Tax=Streptomyces durbertensis TaxID=2448886 RepID=A0ABR6EAN0_9ACTN|nr:non-ribosomal peptide synthetase [Streptomyces durbertensis]MBB1242386.1 amino acid adenylation domain-containing protein [Streptomyces durbertensis]
MTQNQPIRGSEPFPLTEVQEAFYVGRSLDPGAGGGTRIHVEFEVPALDVGRLERSWNRLVAVTEMLRARLLPDGRQLVEDDVPAYRVACHDLTGATGEEKEGRLARLRAEAAAGIDPHRWPLFSLAAVELPEQRTRVLLTVDELIADGPSVSLLLQEWYAGYRDDTRPSPPDLTFRDYALAVNATSPSTEALDHWRKKLAAVDFDHLLPAGARAVGEPAAGEHRRLVLRLDRTRWEGVLGAARGLRATPSALLLALTSAALGGVEPGGGSLPVVLTTYNRRPIHRDVPRLVGPFLSTSVFVAPEPTGTLGELVAEVRGQLWQDLEYSEVSGVRALRERFRAEPGRRPVPLPIVFTSLLGSITDHHADDPHNWAAAVDLNASATRTAGVALEMCVQERAGELCVSWDLDATLLDAAWADNAFSRLEGLLHRIEQLGTAVWDTSVAGPAREEELNQPPLTEVQSAYLVGRLGQLGGSAETRVYQEFLLQDHKVDALEAAWNRLVAHHPMLRAAIRPDGVQEVAEQVPWYRIVRHDLTGQVGDPRGQDAVEQRLSSTAERLRGGTFPLGERPMYVLEASLLPGGDIVLHVVLDALLADARSFALLFGQLFALHDGDESVLAEPADPRPLLLARAARAAGERAEAAREGWREKFAALPSGPALPEPAPDAHRLHRRTELGSWSALTRRAAEIGVPADMVLLTAYTDELRREFGPEPFTITVVSWDRPAGAEHMVADFTQLAWVVVDDTLPVGFADRSRELWARTRADLERGELRPGLAELRGRVFRSGGALRLPVVFTRVPELDPGLSPRDVRLRTSQSQTAQVALDHVPLLVGDSLVGQWDAAHGALPESRLTDLFEGYARRVGTFLDEGVGGAAPPAAGLPAGSVRTDEPWTMTELLADAFERYADQVAVRWDGRTVDYRELDRRTARLANQLTAHGVRPGEHVAVHMDRSDDLVVALVGIVRAGAVYVPVDPANPPERVRYLLADSGARVVVADAARAAVPAEAGAVVLCQDRAGDQALLAAQPTTAPDVALTPDDPVYTIYTSGTTGRPKGCRNTHRGFVNRLRWMQSRFPLGVEDRVAQKTPYGFDVSAWEFFWPLLAGASIVVARPGGHVDPGYLARLLRDERVTVAHFVPSVLGLFLRDPGAAGCESLRYVFASGEALPVATMRRFFQVLPGGPELHNLYGPTEAAIDVTHWACRADWEEPTVPIGRPISGLRIHVVDDRLRRVPDGTVGEIVIGGVGVALGYHQRPELTAERFVPSPFPDDPSPRLYRTGDLGRVGEDGEIRYLGRADGQFKLRGLRIEPEEVEVALTDLPQVQEARVLPVTDRSRGEQLLAAVCVPARGRPAPSVAQLRRELADALPAYLVPSGFRFVERLPLTANGKLDRPAAAALFGDNPSTDPAPRQENTVSEQPSRAAEGTDRDLADVVAGIRDLVAECLDVTEVATGADLFDLGATSFTMIRLAQGIERSTGVALPVDALISGPTVTALAAAVVAAGGRPPTAPAVPDQPAVARRPAVPARPAVTAEAVAAEVAELLGQPEVDPEADLFDLGATSFTMIRLAQRVAERFNAEVPVDALIRTPTARGIVAALGSTAGTGGPGTTAGTTASAVTTGSVAAGSPADVRIAFDPAAKAAFKEARHAERRLPATLDRIPLPDSGPEHERAAFDASSFREFDDGPVPGERLSTLLATLARGELDGRSRFRYPSAGGFYPVQVYVYVKPEAVSGVDGGLYYLHPGERSLVALAPLARFGTDVHVLHNRQLVGAASFGVFLVSTPQAIAPAYGERNAARFSTIEAGHVAQALLTAAPGRGLGLCAVGEMDFDAVREHFGLQDGQELLLSLWGGALPRPAVHRRAELVAAERCSPAASVPTSPPLPVPAGALGAGAEKDSGAVAVVGFAADLPGARTLRELDALLTTSGTGIGPVPAHRWTPLESRAERDGARVGGYLADVTSVEAEEFGLSPAEAVAIDPQERLLLSVVRRCLEDAAVTPERLAETGRVGVYAGAMWQDHALHGVAERAAGGSGTHATRGGLAHRVSHTFGLTGPSMLLDTGCVSGLAAVEAAYRAVLDGRCEAAVAAGTNLVLHPDHLDVLSAMGLVAETPDSCAFTERATGWIVGEGVGAVLLKRLDRALADGDHVHAVLRGGALLHAGTTRQFGVPDPGRQEEVMRAALDDADLGPGDIGYVEAAAAGAALADALEFSALRRLFGAEEPGGSPVPVGTVKPNTGHLEAASVFAQLGKLIGQFRRERLYPTRMTAEVNPALGGRRAVALAGDSDDRWRTAPGQPRRALVNGFAGGGTYGCLVVEEPPRPATGVSVSEADAPALLLSADTPAHLADWAEDLARELDRRTDLTLGQVARTLREGRRARRARGAVVADRHAAASALRTLAERTRREGGGTLVELTEPVPEDGAVLAGWLAGGPVVLPPVAGAPRRVALPAVPLELRDVPLPVPTGSAPVDLTTGPGTDEAGADDPFARLAAVVGEELGVATERISPTDDLFAMGANSRQLLRVAARVTAAGGRELPLEALFTTPNLATLADLAFPALETV